MDKRARILVMCIVLSTMAGALWASGEKEAPAKAESIPTVKILLWYQSSINRKPKEWDVNENPVIDMHRKASGVNVQFEMLPPENMLQRVTLVLASGDVPDLINSTNVRDGFYNFVNQGLFEKLDDLLKTHAPKVRSMIPENAWDGVRVNGAIYGVPYAGVGTRGGGIYVREDLLKKLGVQMPKTTAEYRSVLVKARDALGIIPYTTRLDNVEMRGAFGVANDVIERNGKLSFAWTHDDYRDYLAYMNDLYANKLLDGEFAVNPSAKLEELLASGRALFSTVGWWQAKSAQDTLSKRDPSAVVGTAFAPVGPKGYSGVPAPNPISHRYAVPVRAKEKVGAMKYLNAMAGDDMIFFHNYGIEGLHFTRVDGKIVSTPEQIAAQDFVRAFQIVDSIENFKIRLYRKDFGPYYDPLLAFPEQLNPLMNMPPLPEFDGKLAELRSFANENSVKFIVGERPISQFPDFVREFNSRGGDAAIAAAAKWYATAGK